MINKVILVGNMCEDPSLKFTQSGQAVTNFSLATNRKWKDKDGNNQDETEFHRIVVWGATAEFCANYMTKGKKAYIEGRLQTRSYEDSNNVKKYTTEIVAQTVQNLSPKEASYDKQGNLPKEDKYPQYGGGLGTGSDVPFACVV